MESKLLDKTFSLLEQDHRSLRSIADGAGVNYHWLAKLKQRKFRDPGVDKIERLHAYLSERRAVERRT